MLSPDHAQKAPEEKSIAVLPFLNLSTGAENEYFSDGMTEEIINALTRVEGLKVIARTSSFAFKGKHLDIRRIGAALGVKTILEGSIRRAGDRVRITAQLINATDGTHIWSHSFDRELHDIFALQDEISLLIADQVRENFGHLNIQAHLVEAPTPSVAAYESFLKGRHHQLQWTAAGLRAAIAHYDAAIAADPHFARAYYGNLQCYGLLAMWGFMDQAEGLEQAAAHYQLAHTLDQRTAEYPMSFVGRTFWGEWDFPAAYTHLRQALTLNPYHPDALESMTELLLANGYFAEAETYIEEALRVDPLSANHHYTRANLRYFQQQYPAALQQVQRALEISPDFALARELQLMCLIQGGDREGVAALLAQRPAEGQLLPRLLFAVLHDRPPTLRPEVVQQWVTATRHQASLVPYPLFILAHHPAHQDTAMSLLRDLVAQRRGQLVNYRYEPFLKPLRTLPGFAALHTARLVMPAPSSAPKTSPVPDPAELMAQKARLLAEVEGKRAYLDPHLSLRRLAQAIGLTPNRLSFLINDQLGMNFNEFINHYRLAHFKVLALDPQTQHLTLLGLALESGFNSKTVFNTFFKQQEGVTPKAWVQKARQP